MQYAKWFIKAGYDTPQNTFEGNMKLQKLLYFAQLIHLAKYDKVLFDDPIYAFEHGSVIEDIRLEYKNNFLGLVTDANLTSFNFTEEEMDTLNLTIAIYGDASAEELSELNHFHRSWEKAYKNSKMGNYHFKELAEISIDDIKKYDLEGVKKVIKAFEMADNNDVCYEVNGVKFYYDPNEIQMDEELKNRLKEFPAREAAYSICRDESQGIIIY
ncbi:Panacea domain-containing protein [Thermosediminibacter litoriperuensis]|nr:type II toxin-antitoxin system antitoxin SocA domain-containing protein [Thermosediminibacter litoriperuensis]